MTLVRTETDVTAYWRGVRATLPLTSTQMSFVLITAHGAVNPHVTTIDRLTSQPDHAGVELLSASIEHVYRRLTPTGTVALLWSRPGRGPIRDGEALWIREVAQDLRRRRVPAWPAHFANHAFLRVVGADDLAA